MHISILRGIWNFPAFLYPRPRNCQTGDLDIVSLDNRVSVWYLVHQSGYKAKEYNVTVSGESAMGPPRGLSGRNPSLRKTYIHLGIKIVLHKFSIIFQGRDSVRYIERTHDHLPKTLVRSPSPTLFLRDAGPAGPRRRVYVPPIIIIPPEADRGYIHTTGNLKWCVGADT
jgi:hypothetical protein